MDVPPGRAVSLAALVDYSQPTLEGKVAIVTGAGRGIGRAVAEVLAQRGVRVVATGRTWSDLESLQDELGATGRRIEVVAGDVGSRPDVERAVTTAVEMFGGMDILVNNAQSLTFNESVLDITDESLEVPFRSGLLGTLYFMQTCYPHLKSRGGGSIVNFGSATALQGRPGFGSYVVAKEAIRGLTRIAAKEWGPDNIRVNVILPSALTDGTREWVARDPVGAERAIMAVPLQRIGDPALDIARAIAALVSDDFGYLTGATVNLDGGSMLIN